jgi:hypothetical protein
LQEAFVHLRTLVGSHRAVGIDVKVVAELRALECDDDDLRRLDDERVGLELDAADALAHILANLPAGA